jgi:phage N-6-adenine-methyltransferase
MNAPIKTRMPAQRPHVSIQEVETPPELIAAVEHRFGRIDFDLAASAENTKAQRFYSKTDNSLAQSWSLPPSVRVAWCNPEFGNAGEYANKCREVRALRRWTLLLVPMGTQDWACQHVWDQAYVLKLKGRVTFVGHPQGFPKDLILAAYGFGVRGEEVWDWRKECAAK